MVDEDKYIRINDFVDKIYCINLNRRTDRWEEITKQFERFDIKVDRFEAIDGNTLEGKDGSTRATVMSHVAILQDAIDKEYSKICVFEDDIIFCEDFIERFDFYVNNVPKNWDIMYLGCHFHCCSDPKRIKNYIYKSNGNYGCFAMILNNKDNLFQRIIDHSKDSIQPMDNVINDMVSKINSYIFIPFFVKTAFTVSDIGDRSEPFSYDVVDKYFRDTIIFDQLYIHSLDNNDLSLKQICDLYLVNNDNFVIMTGDIVLFDSRLDDKNIVQFCDDYFLLRDKETSYRSVKIKKLI